MTRDLRLVWKPIPPPTVVFARGRTRMRCSSDKLTDLARGPGRLAAALEIDQRLDGADLCANGPLWLGTAVRETAHICTTVRIGITREMGRQLRFFEADSPFVSDPSAR
jgi:DNA-3-methyladenine glycosylase